MKATQDWLDTLTLKQQTVLISAIRGCDGAPRDDPSKPFVRALRARVLNTAVDGPCNFMGAKITQADIERFLKALDPYPMHWLMHFIHAVETIGYGHPDWAVASWWSKLYRQFCHALHVVPEERCMWDQRLADGPPSDCWKA